MPLRRSCSLSDIMNSMPNLSSLICSRTSYVCSDLWRRSNWSLSTFQHQKCSLTLFIICSTSGPMRSILVYMEKEFAVSLNEHTTIRLITAFISVKDVHRQFRCLLLGCCHDRGW
ncbi:hypothetical protein OUZ56_027026 [Daphnia magna]|uniref:Uncharacterized protein n=1 Tax=Daphnia magna TaxID=35525 RepID=A0ABQ9ZNJ4_9CRUS|nr:hypothetical protein OUZ56_027026 [Daphnia magna]